ncbi:MAG: ATP-binding protein [Lapillicoccus sp.]
MTRSDDGTTPRVAPNVDSSAVGPSLSTRPHVAKADLGPRCAYSEPTVCELADTTLAPLAARDFVRRTTCPHHPTDVEDACLLVTEVVTNALRYGEPPVVVECQCVTDAVVFDVSDAGSSYAPIVLDPAPDDAEAGRGLAIVDGLALGWGVDDHPHDGKSVWFALDADGTRAPSDPPA